MNLKWSHLLVAGVAAISISACSKGAPEKAQAATTADADAVPEVLATIGDQKVTLADLRDRIGDQLDQLDANYKKARSKAIEDALSSMLRERIINDEAKKQGKSMEDLVLAEAGGTFEPTEVEVAAWYNENQGRLRGRNLDQLRGQIVELLRKQKQDKAEQVLEARLNKARSVKINFQPYRLAFDNSGSPSLGKKGSKVTVVEFSDFQCPFCRQFAGNLRELGREYGDRVEIVYRQYPIPSLHPFAFKAAEASLCANEQGKFWELHDLMFTDQEHITVKDLKEKARRLGNG
jgi:hypothetical protein